jgi:glycosyltransferase involved in cell wall biosynthesis
VGGAEHVLLGLAGGVDRSRFEPIVACIGRDMTLAPRFAEAGVEVRSLGVSTQLDPRGLTRLIGLAKRVRPSVIHGFLWRANMCARLAGRLCRIPAVVTSEHSMHFDGPIREFVNRVTGPWSSAVVCVSHGVRAYVRDRIRIPDDRLEVIYNGVDLERFAPGADRAAMRVRLGLPVDRPIIGTVARHTEEKRIDRLVEVAERVAARHPDVVFLTAGDGPTLPRVIEMARGLGLDFRFLGRRDDVPAVLGALDVFVVTSETEGLPIAVIEAMAAGLPVVSVLVGGVGEIVHTGREGILVEQGDLDGVVEGIVRLLGSQAEREEMGRLARERVASTVTLEAMVQRYEGLYDRLIGGDGTGGHAGRTAH